MSDSGVVVQHLPNGGTLVQCANPADCQRMAEQFVAHWRLVWFYLPLAVLVLLIVPGLVLLGKRLRSFTYRRPERQKQTLMLMFGGVLVMAAIAKPLAGLIHSWSVDALLGGLILWGLGSIAIVGKMRRPRDRRE